jgi:uncharacterized protein (TIGR03067 family)
MFTVCLLMAGATVAAPAPPDPVEKAQAALQGTWRCVGGEEKGEKFTAEEAKEEGFSLVITKNELVLHQGKEKPQRFSFTLGPGKSPAHIDLKEIGDDARAGVCHAIYRLEKEELTICFGSNINPDEAEDRPQEFSTMLGRDKGSPKGKVMLIFQREKK